MKVLLVNKFLWRSGGTESVVMFEKDLLEEAGHSVAVFAMSDPRNEPSPWSAHFAQRRRYESKNPIERARNAAASVYSLDARRRLRSLLREFKPDVAHLHNVYHQLSLSVIDELRRSRVPMAMTLHDYKCVCPNYRLLARDGICHRCVDGSPLNAVRYRCLKDSLLVSAVAATEAYVARVGRQYAKVDYFFAPSAFMREVAVRGGLPPERVEVLRNVVPLPEPRTAEIQRPARFVFMGRLVAEKGASVLVDAAALTRENLAVEIYGTGPLEDTLRREAVGGRVVIHGHVDQDGLRAALAQATAHVLPSTWLENCPMSILEAAAASIPTIGTTLGGTPELIVDGKTGLLVPPDDAVALAKAMDELAAEPARAAQLGTSAYARLREEHDAELHVGRLLDVFAQLSATRGSVRAGAAAR
jgi:glycosyltransferase involved in cell wall biosynthesis